MSRNTGNEDPGRRLPFYMTFPYSDNRNMEEEDERDAELLKHLYPPEARRFWPEVEDVCDRLEYDGSIMFDECPDKIQVQDMAHAVCGRLIPEDMWIGMAPEERRRMQDMAEMMLYQEMHRRRRRRRRFQRHFVY